MPSPRRHTGTLRCEPLESRLLLSAETPCWAADFDPAAAANAPLLAAQAVRAADAGSTLATAEDLGPLSGNHSYNGFVGGFDTGDVLKFSLAAGAKVDLGLAGLVADIDLVLHDARGTRLGLSNKSGTAAESISQSLAAGTYYVSVTPWRAAQSAYVLSINVAAPSAPTTPTTPTTPTAPTTSFPDVPYYGGANDWNVNTVNAPEAWAKGYKGAGVVVAVVDTGVDLAHPDLVNQIWVNPGEIAGNGVDDDHNGFVDDVRGWDFAAGDNNPSDGNGHGTHVAGTIAADDNGFGATGIAPDAKIMPVRVLGSDGSGTEAAVAAGIRYAARMGADIINLSLGGGFSSVIQTAIQYAQQLNVLVVVAAGNESASMPSYPARFSASLANVISVGAQTAAGALAGFSNRVGGSGAVQVDAPGVGIYSTYVGGGYRTLSGTSMATPHVAGLAALALSANPNLSAAALRTLIVSGANRSIAGSDSRGGINAAVTVALAASGQGAAAAQAGVAASAGAAAATGAPAASVRRSASYWHAADATFDASFSPSANFTSSAPLAERPPDAAAELSHSPPAARDQAVLALAAADSIAPREHTADEPRQRLCDWHLDDLLGPGGPLAGDDV